MPLPNTKVQIVGITQSTNEYGGAQVDIEVERLPINAQRPQPSVTDLPPGVREALLKWLEPDE